MLRFFMRDNLVSNPVIVFALYPFMNCPPRTINATLHTERRH